MPVSGIDGAVPIEGARGVGGGQYTGGEADLTRT